MTLNEISIKIHEQQKEITHFKPSTKHQTHFMMGVMKLSNRFMVMLNWV